MLAVVFQDLFSSSCHAVNQFLAQILTDGSNECLTLSEFVGYR